MFPEFYDDISVIQPLEVHNKINFPALMEQQHQNELKAYWTMIFIIGMITILAVALQ